MIKAEEIAERQNEVRRKYSPLRKTFEELQKTVAHYAPDDLEVAYGMHKLEEAISGFIHIEIQKLQKL